MAPPPGRAPSHITPRAARAVRVGHAVVGVLLAGMWLVSFLTVGDGAGRPRERAGPHAARLAAGAFRGAAAPGSGTTGADLVLPLFSLGCAVVLALYAYGRSSRRAPVVRTTAGPARPPRPEPAGRADRMLVAHDDAVRTSEEELRWAAARLGDAAVGRFAEAVAFAQAELTAAFRLRYEFDSLPPGGKESGQRLLDGIAAHCTEAGWRLDAEATDLDRARDLAGRAPEALEIADGAFRRVTAAVVDAGTTLAGLERHWAPAAGLAVAGHIGQAEDRLAFAGRHLDAAREYAGRGDGASAAVHLRAAEGALGQAGMFVAGVERFAAELARADGLLPDALAGTDGDLADARALVGRSEAGLPAPDLLSRIAAADFAAAEVRSAVAAGPYDPLGLLRRVHRPGAALAEALAGVRDREAADRRARSLLEAALLTARSRVAAGSDFVTTHRAAVGCPARTRLSEARRRLAQAEQWAASGPAGALAEVERAELLGSRAAALAERDVRAYGNPCGGPASEGTGGALLGGVLLGGHGGGTGGPVRFGGPGTRGRLGGGERF
ncbi:TPM domain-containing protein [Streptomyces sp. NPDC002004]